LTAIGKAEKYKNTNTTKIQTIFNFIKFILLAIIHDLGNI